MRRVVTVLLALTCVVMFSAADQDQLEALASTHQWFALRDAVRAMKHPPLVYRGAVACAFRDVQACERDMQTIIRNGSEADRAEASGFLMLQYALTGRFRLAAKYSKERMRARGAASEADGLDAILSAYGEYPDLVVAARGRSRVPCKSASGHLLIPTLINGKPTSYILDTGANFSMVTESEAKRLGLKTSELRAPRMTDSTGAGFALGRVAVADRLEVGAFRLRNVPFVVVADDLDVMAELPPEARGAIGMQILLAFGIIRWDPAGSIELGGRGEPANTAGARLCLDGLLPLVEGTYGTARLTFVLDTGDSESRLYPRFAREFAALVKDRGRPGTWNLSGAGGAATAQTTELPGFRFNLAGLAANLEPARILAEGAGSEVHHGVIGLDVPGQAQQVTIDFEAMRMTLAGRGASR